MSSVAHYPNFIDGEWDNEGDVYEVKSPINGKTIATAVKADRSKTNAAIDSANRAFYAGWGNSSPGHRRKLLKALADRIQDRSEEYSRLETYNTGKTLRQSTLMDIPLGIEHLNYFALENSFEFERKISHPEYPGTSGIIQYAPVGVVGAIAPWNLPFVMAVWKIGPALLAGNTVVLKPSHYTPLTALELARDANQVGFPRGVINILTGDGSIVGDTLASSSKVNMISFTGSTSTGRRIVLRSASNETGPFKKVTLELGGKSPSIVFSDADIENTAKGVLFSIFLNSGQLCESGSRLLVQNGIKEELLRKVRDYASRMKAGDPSEMQTDISAITTEAQARKIESIVSSGLDQGAKILYQSEMSHTVPEGGFYYPPTILDGVKEDMQVAREEIFGPVLSVLTFSDEDEAIEIANSSRYGLASAVWTADRERAIRVASQIESGTVWINEYHLASAAAPRGGFKESGLGRELGTEGISEYTQTRHLFMKDEKLDSDLEQVAYGLILPGA